MLPVNFFEAPLPYETSIWIYVITAILTVLLACLYYFFLIPFLKTYISNTMLIVLAATVIVGGIVALYVWVLLPVLKKAFGEQTEVTNID
jgi:uncharacterized membrane protein YfhO